MKTRTDPHWSVELFWVGCAVVILLFIVKFGGVDKVVARFASEPQPIQIPALVACRLPTENEQLHVVVHQRGGAFVAECMHVGSRGTYLRPRQGVTPRT